MKKVIALLGVLVCVPAVAEEAEVVITDDAAVVERLSCDDMQARIKELSDVEDDTGEVADEIAKLTQDYRRTCMRSAAGRRTSATTRMQVVVADVEKEVAIEEQDVVPETESVPEETVVEEVEVIVEEVESAELTPEQELDNLNAGLCADGTEPNKFGCCGDEIFKDLGDTVFACCPKSSGDDSDCFPPIN